MGVIDVEIGFDVPGCAGLACDAHLAGIRVRSANGRILLSGSVPDAPLSPGVNHRRSVRAASVSNSMTVRASNRYCSRFASSR